MYSEQLNHKHAGISLTVKDTAQYSAQFSNIFPLSNGGNFFILDIFGSALYTAEDHPADNDLQKILNNYMYMNNYTILLNSKNFFVFISWYGYI